MLGGQSVGKDLNTGINPRIFLQGDEPAASILTMDMSFFFYEFQFVSSLGSKRNGDDNLKKIATDVFRNGGCVAPHTLNV